MGGDFSKEKKREEQRRKKRISPPLRPLKRDRGRTRTKRCNTRVK